MAKSAAPRSVARTRDCCHDLPPHGRRVGGDDERMESGFIKGSAHRATFTRRRRAARPRHVHGRRWVFAFAFGAREPGGFTATRLSPKTEVVSPDRGPARTPG